MPNFVIGIGSQRAGSTLLHRILDECTNIFMHPVKELHYFDTLSGVRDPSVLKEFSKRQLNREFERFISAADYGYVDKRYKCYIRANKILAERNVEDIDYLDLYRPCVMQNEVLGEITPEYMILPDDAVAKMAEKLGVETKIILISRDPVERFISAFKLLKKYNNPGYDSARFNSDLEYGIENMHSWVSQQKQLNDYQAALRKYEKYFNNVLHLSFEDMLGSKQDSRSKIEGFLDQSVCKEKYEDICSKKVNSIGETQEIDAKLLRKIEIMLGGGCG